MMKQADRFLSDLRRRVRSRLLPWFARNRRDLPWRRDRTPYRVLVSEMMLQQTRVDQALDYFLRFTDRFPTVEALAEADLQDVLRVWAGLGYYARARHLHAAARAVVRERGGRFPDTIEGWRSLPGVGAYTAAAVGSLAQNLDAAVVDGNVVRVLSRLMAEERPAKDPATRRFFQAAADRLLIRGRAGEFNEALMELGATVCRPKSPLCGVCPLRGACRAREQGDPMRYPGRTAARPKPHKVVGAAVISNRRGEILLARRRDEGFLGGLWEFPGGKREPGESLRDCIARELKEEMALDLAVGDLLTVVEHEYSHFTIELHAYRARIRRGRPRCLECADYAWVKPVDMHRYPLSRADHWIADAVRADASAPGRGPVGRRKPPGVGFRGGNVMI